MLKFIQVLIDTPCFLSTTNRHDDVSFSWNVSCVSVFVAFPTLCIPVTCPRFEEQLVPALWTWTVVTWSSSLAPVYIGSVYVPQLELNHLLKKIRFYCKLQHKCNFPQLLLIKCSHNILFGQDLHNGRYQCQIHQHLISSIEQHLQLGLPKHTYTHTQELYNILKLKQTNWTYGATILVSII